MTDQESNLPEIETRVITAHVTLTILIPKDLDKDKVQSIAEVRHGARDADLD